MDTVKYVISAVIGIVVGAAIGVAISSWMRRGKCTVCMQHTDTIRRTVYDTIPYYIPVPIDSFANSYETVRLPTVLDTVRVVYNDTILHDSANVIVPIMQYVYRDSSYTAWVSGFHPSLDSIKVYRKTVYQEVKNKSSRIGLGVMAGYGFGKGVTTPFIGIGVFYKLF